MGNSAGIYPSMGKLVTNEDSLLNRAIPNREKRRALMFDDSIETTATVVDEEGEE